MRKINHAEKFVSVEEWNQLKSKYSCFCQNESDFIEFSALAEQAYVEESNRYIRLWIKDSKHCTAYTADLAKNEVKDAVLPNQASRKINKYYKVPVLYSNYDSYQKALAENKETAVYCPYVLYNKEKHTFSANAAGPYIRSFRDTFDGTIYEYDINNAYGSILKSGVIPDTTAMRYFGVVPEGCIGFNCDKELSLVHEGNFADIICPLIKTDLDLWVKELGDICEEYRKNPTKENRVKKYKAKKLLVLAIGAIQRKNPILRAYVVNSCNEKLENLVDGDTILANTDAIYSAVPRPDIDVGTAIGQFKLDVLPMRTKNLEYQVYKDNSWETHYRGTPGEWFAKDFNILTDELPTKDNNKYEYRGDYIYEKTN